MPPASSSAPARFLHSFDGLRCAAVVLVLLQHETFLARKYLGVSFAGGVFGLGEYRIDLFFLLSGFFAAWVAGRGHESENPGIHFLGRRLRRLLPLLWVLTSLKLLLMLGLELSGRKEGLSWFQVLRSYTLLPAAGYPVILAAWTLSFELVFCAFWSLLLCVSQRLRLAALGGWAAAVVAYGLLHHTPSLDLPGFALHPYFLDFMAGAVLAEFAPRRAARVPGPVLLAIGAVVLAVAITFQPELKDLPALVQRMVWGGGAALVVAGLFRWERGRPSVTLPSGVRLLAQASYSIYLTHSLVLYVVVQGLRGRLTEAWWTQPLLAAVAAVTLGIGVLVHRRLEIPLQRALHPGKPARSSAPVAS